MEQDSCHSEPLQLPSDQSSELDENDPAFAKTPIRATSEEDDADASSSESSQASAHFNDRGDKTYFHVWSDMLTCEEMSLLDQKAASEVPKYVEGDDDLEQNSSVHKPLSIDTSLPCPLIQFGPVPRKRRPPLPTSASVVVVVDDAAKPVEVAGDAETAAAAAAAAAAATGLPDKPPPTACPGNRDERGGESQEHSHDERCCDFSLVAAKNNARLRQEERLRRREQRKLVRY